MSDKEVVFRIVSVRSRGCFVIFKDGEGLMLFKFLRKEIPQPESSGRGAAPSWAEASGRSAPAQSLVAETLETITEHQL